MIYFKAMFVERKVGYSWCKQKMTSFSGAGKVGKNDVSWGQANSTGMPPDQKVKKAE